MKSAESKKLERFNQFSMNDSSADESETCLRVKSGRHGLLTQPSSSLSPEATEAIISEVFTMLSKVNPHDLETTFQSVKDMRDLLLRNRNSLEQTVDVFIMADPLSALIPFLGFQQYPALQVSLFCFFSSDFF